MVFLSSFLAHCSMKECRHPVADGQQSPQHMALVYAKVQQITALLSQCIDIERDNLKKSLNLTKVENIN
jgi:hypothetical protein